DLMDDFVWANAGHRDDNPTQFVNCIEGSLEGRLTRNVRVIRVRKNRAADFVAPAVLTEPRNSDERMAFGRTLLLVRITLVIHVMQQADRLPKIDIFAAQLREMSHRVSDRVAMFP